MPLTRLLAGSNRIINRSLLQSDGSALSAENITSGYVELVQNGVVKAKIVFGSGSSALRAGSDGNSLDLELTGTTTSSVLAKGAVTERYYIEIVAVAFLADSQKARLKVEFTELEIA